MTTTTLPTIEHKRLYGTETFQEGRSAILALMFGELVTLYKPFMDHYTSDLFHDVRWINEYVTGPTSFYFGCDAWGTSIGMDKPLVGQSRQNVWHVSLIAEQSAYDAEHNDRATWFVTCVPVQVAGTAVPT